MALSTSELRSDENRTAVRHRSDRFRSASSTPVCFFCLFFCFLRACILVPRVTATRDKALPVLKPGVCLGVRPRMSEEQTVSLVDVLEEDEELEEEASAVLAGSDAEHCSYPQVSPVLHGASM